MASCGDPPGSEPADRHARRSTTASAAGPAIWIRCVVDRTLGEIPEDEVPIVYVPGYDRSDLRAIEECPAELQPIAELQYRGTFFGSRAGRDWTTTAFFSNREEGLGIELGRDAETEAAFARALHVLLDEPVASLREKAPLRAADLGALLDPDPVKTLLRWLDDPTSIECARRGGAGRSSCALPATTTASASPRTARSPRPSSSARESGAWQTVWERFAENPSRYPGVVERLRQARPEGQLDRRPPGVVASGQRGRGARAPLGAHAACTTGRPTRCAPGSGGSKPSTASAVSWVWADARAGAAGRCARASRRCLPTRPSGSSPATPLPRSRRRTRLRAGALTRPRLLAMAAVDATPDRQAVEGVVAALYRPWADACARRFQESAVAHGAAEFGRRAGDPGRRRMRALHRRAAVRPRRPARAAPRERGVEAELGWQLAALPSLTATAKPAVSPAASRLAGGSGFDTIVAETGQAVTAEVLRKTIASEGITVVANGALAEPGASGWTEFGNIDEIGHSHGDRFPHAVAAQVSDIADRVLALLDAGLGDACASSPTTAGSTSPAGSRRRTCPST